MSDITKACRDIKELSPMAQIACNLFMAECKTAGLNVLLSLKHIALRLGKNGYMNRVELGQEILLHGQKIVGIQADLRGIFARMLKGRSTQIMLSLQSVEKSQSSLV